MAHSQNKSLIEYGELNSVHHEDKHLQEEQAARKAALAQEPPRLWIVNGAGNLYKIEWTHTLKTIPKECQGSWNHKGRAQDAIDGATARLKKEANAQMVSEEAKAVAAAKPKATGAEMSTETAKPKPKAKRAKKVVKVDMEA